SPAVGAGLDDRPAVPRSGLGSAVVAGEVASAVGELLDPAGVSGHRRPRAAAGDEEEPEEPRELASHETPRLPAPGRERKGLEDGRLAERDGTDPSWRRRCSDCWSWGRVAVAALTSAPGR